MPAALLSLTFLVVITVDPRLEGPLRLLAEVGVATASWWARRTSHRAAIPMSRCGSAICRRGPAGSHVGGTWHIWIAKALLDEDPTALATVLVHGLRHAMDLEDAVKGDWHPVRLYLEARAFEDHVIVACAWPGPRSAACRPTCSRTRLAVIGS